MKARILKVSFQAYFKDGGSSRHYAEVKETELGKWLDCYKFTHPNCESITIKYWFDEKEAPG